jgi:hypothetical protein
MLRVVMTSKVRLGDEAVMEMRVSCGDTCTVCWGIVTILLTLQLTADKGPQKK